MLRQGWDPHPKFRGELRRSASAKHFVSAPAYSKAERFFNKVIWQFRSENT